MKAKLKRSEQKVLDALSSPMRIPELAQEVGLSRQGVHNLIPGLEAKGLIRISGRPNRRYIARQDDPVTLLSSIPAQVLSAFPLTGARTIATVARSTKNTVEAVARAIETLHEFDLITIAADQDIEGVSTFSLTPAGAAHVQYDANTSKAKAAPLPVRSQRVWNVLALLDSDGPRRSSEVGKTLDVAPHSINALFQYLKRKSFIEKTGGEVHAPYSLTDQGRRALRRRPEM